MKFRKKPIVIEAMQLTHETFWEVYNWISDSPVGRVCEWCWDSDIKHLIPERYLIIETLEGKMKSSEGDWIIQGVNGEFYPCKPDIFEKTYEEVQG